MTDNLEYVVIPCPRLTAKDFHKSFFPHLPKEYFSITENDAAAQLEAEMISILGSQDIFNELKQDCRYTIDFLDFIQTKVLFYDTCLRLF